MAYTLQSGQAVIAVTGTAVQLSSSTIPLNNGVIIAASSGNNAAGGTVGPQGVTNTTNGTGNGIIIAAGALVSLGGSQGVSPSLLYVNGTAGDVFSFIGN